METGGTGYIMKTKLSSTNLEIIVSRRKITTP
jgi:hypothetical protein